MTAFTRGTRKQIGLNRIMYTLLVVLGACYFFAWKDMGMAMSSLGLALVFDPFHPANWSQRLLWQKLWLLLHLAVVFALLGFMAATKF